MFSQIILNKVKNSAIEHVQRIHQQEISCLMLAKQVRLLTGYTPSEDFMSDEAELNKIISLLTASLQNERRKSRLRSPSYNCSRHLELNKLIDLLKQKRGKLFAHRV